MKRLIVAAIAVTAAVPAWSAADGMAQERRAYRDACARYESYGWCECMGAGMAQALSPAEMRLARAALREQHESANAETAAATAEAAAAAPQYVRENRMDSFARIREVEAGLTAACMQFRDDVATTQSAPPRPAAQTRRAPGS